MSTWGGNRKGAGRPSKPAGLTERVLVRLDRETVEWLRWEANDKKMTVGAWIRRCILNTKIDE